MVVAVPGLFSALRFLLRRLIIDLLLVRVLIFTHDGSSLITPWHKQGCRNPYRQDHPPEAFQESKHHGTIFLTIMCRLSLAFATLPD